MNNIFFNNSVRISCLFALCVVLLFTAGALAQPFFNFAGDYNYLLNRLPTDTMVLTPDKRTGVVFTSVFQPQRGGQLNSFDLATGALIDTEFAGFGPLQADLVQLNDGIKVVALTSRGGPNTISIFNMNSAGQMTFQVETTLTTSSSDERSNLVLSSRGRAGFVRVRNAMNVSELVSFSLDSGAILHRASLPVSDILNLYEDPTRTIIASGAAQTLYFVNATNPSQLTLSGQTALPPTGLSGSPNDIFSQFSSDGTVVFAGGGNAKLTAVNTNTLQIVGSLDQPYATSNLKLIEIPNKRYLALYGGNDTFLGLNLVDATMPATMAIVSQVDLRSEFFRHRDITFGRNAKTVILSADTGLSTYRVPSLIPLHKTPLKPPTLFGFTVESVGTPERIIGAWGSDNNFSARVYSVPNKINTRVNFDLDGKSEIGVFTPSASWKWLRSIDDTPSAVVPFGQVGDLPVPGDYDGDEKTDLAVFRPNAGRWQILESSTATVREVSFGIGADVPVPADFDGDGKTDVAVFRPSPNRWLVIQSSDGQLAITKAGFGRVKPVTGDYDGDTKADRAIFADGVWNIKLSTGGSQNVTFGQIGDVPVSGDFDNDGKSDVAIYRPSTRTWRIQQSYSGLLEQQFGQASDVPVPADYDGDGRTDIAVYRSSTSTWQIIQSSGSGVRTVQFGSAGDQPLTEQK